MAVVTWQEKRSQAKALALYFTGRGGPLNVFPQRGDTVRFMFQLRRSGDFKGSPTDVVGLHIYPNLPGECFRLLPFCRG